MGCVRSGSCASPVSGSKTSAPPGRCTFLLTLQQDVRRDKTPTGTSMSRSVDHLLPNSPAATSAEPFDHHGHALATAHAHGLETELLVVETKAVDQRGGDARAGHAERMAHRDRAAVDVQLVDVDAEILRGRQHLRRERLVDLDEVDVV